MDIDEIARQLFELQSTIIHFSGHCDLNASTKNLSSRERDIGIAASNGGICLEDDFSRIKCIPGAALADIIRTTTTSARVAVLNCCYSDAEAEGLCTAVDCVIGMAGAIRDSDACSFAIAFYRALGNRCSIVDALEHARATLVAKQAANENLPCSRTREGVDARQIVLV